MSSEVGKEIIPLSLGWSHYIWEVVPSNFDDNLNNYDYNPTNCEIL